MLKVFNLILTAYKVILIILKYISNEIISKFILEIELLFKIRSILNLNIVK